MCEVVGAGVRRRLFGDEGGSAGILKAAQLQLRARDRDRWNFDFESGTPLPGRYQWEPLATHTSVQSKITDYLRQRKGESSGKVRRKYKPPRDYAKDIQNKAAIGSRREIYEWIVNK